jgi:hypothetical protein
MLVHGWLLVHWNGSFRGRSAIAQSTLEIKNFGSVPQLWYLSPSTGKAGACSHGYSTKKMTSILRVAHAVFRYQRPNMTALNNPMSGWVKMKIQLDKISSVPDWWLLHIRCTVGANMAELTVPLLTIS